MESNGRVPRQCVWVVSGNGDCPLAFQLYAHVWCVQDRQHACMMSWVGNWVCGRGPFATDSPARRSPIACPAMLGICNHFPYAARAVEPESGCGTLHHVAIGLALVVRGVVWQLRAGDDIPGKCSDVHSH